MKVARINRFGGPEVFEIVDISIPKPNSGQVLVRVGAAGINFAETLMRENRYAVTPELPAILGTEVSGTVVGTGRDVNGVTIGTRVAAPLFGAGVFIGGYSEYVVADAALVVPLPDELSFEDSTALMVQGLTAQYLLKQAPVKGKTVLINAAAGGVGSLLVQLAKRVGAKMVIAAASSSQKTDFALSLGADVGINYKQPGWGEEVLAVTGGSGPDVIYESVGGSITKESLGILAPMGQVVIYGSLNIQEFNLGVPELLGLIFKNQSITGFAVAPLLTLESLRNSLAELFDLAVSHQLKVTIGGVYPLEQVTQAHQALEGRSTTGKLVLVP
ncbi:NADPH2:quinone reductase [Trichlorobacter thiogenes]|uniref:NADPH2:quinone reductase n=1 Tax=Trichlorobacter thiogenes TaxID=115783 RepID=A0A1T4S5H7_9BACT|nr:zinc-binding dehydrogenase [Trichlorobacter thiogenes]SKA23485.1 NADPH2:quinone reductase [Trichlorobacter thiogenes]